MSNITLQQCNDSCAACGDDYKTREPTIYDMGVKSTPIIFGMVLSSEFYKKNIQLYFCDKHGNGSLRHVTRYLKGVLQIRNVKTNRWRKAEKIGVVV